MGGVAAQTLRKRRVAQPVRSADKDCLEHFEAFCAQLELPDDAGPFILQPYQKDALKDYFEHGAMEHLWFWPTGMGKSALLGALALHHATYVRVNPRVTILGGLGGHGKHTLRAASWFIARDRQLQRWWIAQEYGMGRIKSLIHEDADGVIEVSSAGRRVGGRGGSSQEGETPSLVLVEELHRHEDDGAAVRTLTTKVQKRTVGRHRVRIVHVTTAGDSLESPLGRMVQRAVSEESHVERPNPYYTRAVDADEDLVAHLWQVPDEISLPSVHANSAELDKFLDHVKGANPATFIQKANLRRSWKASVGEPWIFARQHCNQWRTQYEAVIDRYDWQECEVRGRKIPKGAKNVYVGLDTATKQATTAIVPLWIDPEDRIPVTSGAVILKSADTSHQRRMRDVIGVLEGMYEHWPRLKLVFDRNWGGGLIAEQFEEDQGWKCVDHSQGVPMELASMLLSETVSQHELRHDGNEEVTAHVLAAVAKKTYHGKRWRLDRPRTKEPIDGAVALAMALHIAKQEQEALLDPSVFRVQSL